MNLPHIQTVNLSATGTLEVAEPKENVVNTEQTAPETKEELAHLIHGLADIVIDAAKSVKTDTNGNAVNTDTQELASRLIRMLEKAQTWAEIKRAGKGALKGDIASMGELAGLGRRAGNHVKNQVKAVHPVDKFKSGMAKHVPVSVAEDDHAKPLKKRIKRMSPEEIEALTVLAKAKLAELQAM